jgi:hypothetical protein
MQQDQMVKVSMRTGGAFPSTLRDYLRLGRGTDTTFGTRHQILETDCTVAHPHTFKDNIS